MTKDEKPDLRSNPPVKVKLPSLVRPSPPPVKDKPGKVSRSKSNSDLQTADQFDGVEPAPEKLSHPTAGRAKPPGRRPPSGLVSPGQLPIGSLQSSQLPINNVCVYSSARL
ncbi:unnamed protein product [Boreogadus saida]